MGKDAENPVSGMHVFRPCCLSHPFPKSLRHCSRCHEFGQQQLCCEQAPLPTNPIQINQDAITSRQCLTPRSCASENTPSVSSPSALACGVAHQGAPLRQLPISSNCRYGCFIAEKLSTYFSGHGGPFDTVKLITPPGCPGAEFLVFLWQCLLIGNLNRRIHRPCTGVGLPWPGTSNYSVV